MTEPMQPPLRIALLSCAHPRANAYAAALQASSSAELIGVWDAVAAAGARFSKQHNTRFAPDLPRLLAEKPDAVIVASETVLRPELVEQAAEAGARAILCETPLAITLADAQAMVTACAARGAKLATAFPCRFSPIFQRLKAAVDAGKLGTIIAIRAAATGKCPFGWAVDPQKSGGGAIMDQATHVADLNRLLLGSEAVEVYAETNSKMYHQDTWEDSALLTIIYCNNVFTTLDASWSRPLKSFPARGGVTMEIIGDGGIAQVDLSRQASILHTEIGQPITQIYPWGSDVNAMMIGEFVSLAAGRAAPILATGEDGVAAFSVALGAYESMRTGEPTNPSVPQTGHLS